MANKDQIKETFAKLLGDKERDFKFDPITAEETGALLETLFCLIEDLETDPDLVPFFTECLKVVKQNMKYN